VKRDSSTDWRLGAPPSIGTRSARGFSLVELMIAMALSGFVMLVVVALYSQSRETYTHQEELGRLQENVRVGMGIIERTVRQGNYKQIPAARDQNPLLVEAFSFQQLRGSDGGGSANDWFQITFNGSSITPFVPAETADGAIVDCLGQPVRASDTRNNRFQVSVDANGRSWLGCSRPGATAPGFVGLIPDVEAMEVLYGQYTDESRTVASFQPWSAAIEPARVVALRIAMLYRSAAELAPAPSSTTYDLAGRTLGPFNDRFIRIPIETTIVIRSTAM